MSINPPPPPNQPPPPPGGQPPEQPPPPGQAWQDPQADAEAAKKKQRMYIALGVIVSIALIVGAYFLGQKTEADKYAAGQPAYNEIYAAGVKSGTAAGTASGKAEGETTGKEEGVAEGTEKGKKSGLAEGEQQGQAEGVSEGQQQGASEALGGLTGWDTGTPYAVEFGEGPNSNIPYAVTSRTLFQPGVLYKLCSDGSGLCTTTASSSSSTSGGATP